MTSPLEAARAALPKAGRTFIIAENHQHARVCAQRYGLSLNSPRTIVLTDRRSAERLQGVRMQPHDRVLDYSFPYDSAVYTALRLAGATDDMIEVVPW